MAEIINYSTKQKGYGRQALYIDIELNNLLIKDVYVEDVFPNIQEHYDFILTDEAFESENGEYFTDSNGNGEYEETYDTVLDYLKHAIDLSKLDYCGYAISYTTEPVLYLSDPMGNKTTKLRENAFLFETEKEAEEYMISFAEEQYFELMYVEEVS